MGMDKIYENILIMSDSHCPYHHPDMAAFYKEVKRIYGPFDKVCHIGDEVDYHAISFHETDPDLLSPSQELDAAVRGLQPIYDLFPKVDVIDSNHGSLVYRKVRAAGLPKSIVRSYNEILKAPKGWEWHNHMIINIPGNKLYVHHGKAKPVMKLSKNMSMCAVQGHYHSSFDINYWANPTGLFWQMTVGCMINDKSLAFEYNKTTLDRPMLGCGISVNGQPLLIPMILGEDGRWIGSIL